MTSVADGQIYAVKQIDIAGLDARQQAEVAREAQLLSSLDSPYIVKYYETFVDGGQLCIVMEFCDNGDLSKKIAERKGHPFDEESIWHYFIELCLALRFLHSKKILHRDIKPMNVFLTSQNHAKLGDFGVSKVLRQNENFARTIVGTPYYLSPELCEKRPYNNKSDVWSLGCVLYELCALRRPFLAQSEVGLAIRIIRSQPAALPKHCSKDLAAVIASCLKKDYRQRPAVQDILAMDCTI